MVFATAARHDQTLARHQSAIEAPDSEAFKTLADHGEAKGRPHVALRLCGTRLKADGCWRSEPKVGSPARNR